MNRVLRMRMAFCALAMTAACFVVAGCGPAHGHPGPGPEVARPDEVLAFTALYQQNCAACHGSNGQKGAAVSLANPVYVAWAGEANIRNAIAHGVPGKLMPAFAKSSGGMLTDRQVAALSQGIVQQWGAADALAGQTPPPYVANLMGNAEHGQQAYGVYCARCHGASGEGSTGQSGRGKIGSIADPSYLALISDQSLRAITVAGRPDQGMPDWRTDGPHAMTDQETTDILAWLASKRVANPGQPYPARP